jgi:hypothetical protein
MPHRSPGRSVRSQRPIPAIRNPRPGIAPGGEHDCPRCLYLISNHDGKADRSGKEAAASRAQFNDYVRTTAGTGGPAGEIETAKKLLDDGAITQAEFDAIKAKALGSATAA